MNSGLRSFLVVLALLTASAASAQIASSRIHIIDATKTTQVSDVIVTVDGGVLLPDASGGYEVPRDTQLIMLRASGYRAAIYRSSDPANNNSYLSRAPFTVKALFLTEYGIASPALRNPVLDIILHGQANALVINIKSDHGLLVYPSQIPLATSIGARKLTTIRSLSELVTSCHDQGIYMIAYRHVQRRSTCQKPPGSCGSCFRWRALQRS